jgi:NAD-specific glutamate dehydrogenase
LRGIEPFDGLVDSSFQLRLVGKLKFVCQFLVAEGVAEIVSIRFKTGDAARLASRLVGGRDVQDTVSINVEGNFNLWNTARSRRNARQLKLAEELVVLGASTLSFVSLNKYTRLVVGVGGEDVGLLGGDGSVTLDEGSHDTIPRERGATSRRRS